jgi:hypothetical protein
VSLALISVLDNCAAKPQMAVSLATSRALRCERPNLTSHMALSDELPTVRCASRARAFRSQTSIRPNAFPPTDFSNLSNARGNPRLRTPSER